MTHSLDPILALTFPATPVALDNLAADERFIANKLAGMLQISPRVHGVASHEGLQPDQVTAIDVAMAHNVFILTGPPGTGKTYTVQHLIESFPGATIELAAPTGKAAKRMSEMTDGRPAFTIHKLLEYQPDMAGGFSPTRNEMAPLEADLVILDECSMIDVSLMANFLRALPTGCRLVMVGDPNQLPSVGPGNVLRDLIAAGVPSVELTTIKRQDPGDVVLACHAIKNGKPPRINNATTQDLFLFERALPEEIIHVITALVAERLPRKYELDPLRDIQVLSPRREKCGVSCEALNKALQVALNDNRPPEKCRFAVADKVIQTRNDNEAGLINGDIGYVLDIDMDGERRRWHYIVEFENPTRVLEIPLHQNDLELAYALTVHKFQGSEAPIVVMPVHKSMGPMFQRNLLYTAISRAKKVMILVGQAEEIPRVIRRTEQLQRHTQLAEYFGNAISDARGESRPQRRPAPPPAPPPVVAARPATVVAPVAAIRPSQPVPQAPPAELDLDDILSGWSL